MHFRNGQAQGFALFASGSLARAAVDAIQNLVFDNDSVLRAEMAHKNMWVLRRAGPPGAARPWMGALGADQHVGAGAASGTWGSLR